LLLLKGTPPGLLEIGSPILGELHGALLILPFLGWRSSAVDCDGNKVQQGVALNLLDSFARLFECA
jgi:hypothetical protein